MAAGGGISSPPPLYGEAGGSGTCLMLDLGAISDGRVLQGRARSTETDTLKSLRYLLTRHPLPIIESLKSPKKILL